MPKKNCLTCNHKRDLKSKSATYNNIIRCAYWVETIPNTHSCIAWEILDRGDNSVEALQSRIKLRKEIYREEQREIRNARKSKYNPNNSSQIGLF